MSDDAMMETRAEAQAISGEAKYWQQQLELAHRDHKNFLEDGRDVVRRYKGEERRAREIDQTRAIKRFNILYSNTETLKAALFARMAKPDVRRRFTDRDPVGRQVAEIAERALLYSNEIYDAEKQFEAAIQDYLLPGRGIIKLCYEARVSTDDDGTEEVTGQEAYYEHVPWDDFRHEPARQWNKVQWIAFRHLMNRDALHKNNFRNVEKIPLNWSPIPEQRSIPQSYKRAEVWEIWDRAKRKRVWVVPGYDQVPRKDDDPYGLENFFPVAEPLRAIATTDTVLPRALFAIYRDQADGLDEIENRIDRLTEAMKRRGVYDSTIPELKKLSNAPDNVFIPVKNYADLMQKGGLQAAFQVEDIRVGAAVLTELHNQRNLRIQTIYEVIGIADIMRGTTDPRETLGAQRLKSMFGGNRLRDQQNEVQRWIRDTMRICAELLAEHFEPEKLAEMAGFRWQPIMPMPTMAPGLPAMGMPSSPRPGGIPSMPSVAVPPQPQNLPVPGTPSLPSAPPAGQEGVITPEMIQILRSDKLRSYRIDIETDSTVFEDAEAEKKARTELLGAISQFITAWAPIVAAQPALLPLSMELLSFGIRGYKAGRTMEDAIDDARQKLEDAAARAAAQPAPPDPKMQAELAKGAAAQQKAQADIAKIEAKTQADMQKIQAEMAKMQGELELAMAQLGIKREELRMKAFAAMAEPPERTQ